MLPVLEFVGQFAMLTCLAISILSAALAVWEILGLCETLTLWLFAYAGNVVRQARMAMESPYCFAFMIAPAPMKRCKDTFILSCGEIPAFLGKISNKAVARPEIVAPTTRSG